jgi:D-lactate dehydrogenase
VRQGHFSVEWHVNGLASGTGRNMAPFLSLEWGQEGMELMREIKDVFDPTHVLNPGVILNDDPRVHVSNLKHITPVCASCLQTAICVAKL